MNSEPRSERARKRAIKWRLTQIIKVSRGCHDCGYNKDGTALQFDHLRDKKANISNMIRSDYSWNSILEEMCKCEVVCANCHAIRTRRRRSGDL